MAQQEPENCKDLETQPLLTPTKGLVNVVPDEDLFLPRGTKHAPFLDITRICCVACVAIDHGYRHFGLWNTLFTQDWVLQYLYLVCGVCFAMSRRSLLGYEMRLAAYLVIGILMNWLGWVATGEDWKSNTFNVIFHMWFIVGLMLYAIALAPLRSYLRRVQEMSHGRPPQLPADSDGPEHTSGVSVARHSQVVAAVGFKEEAWRVVFVVIGGVAFISIFCKVVLDHLFGLLGPAFATFWTSLGSGASFWGLPSTPAESQGFFQEVSTYCTLTASNVYLIVVMPRVFQQVSFTSWAVLINTYLNRMLWYRSAFERPFHGLDLMMIGLTVYSLGMRHRRTVGIYFARYWFFVIFICGLVWQPGSFGRFDEQPPEDIHMRVRVSFVEAVFILAWLIAGEHIAKPEIFTEDKLEFLNTWALIVFLVHKAVHMIVPFPVNWVFLVALAPSLWLVKKAV